MGRTVYAITDAEGKLLASFIPTEEAAKDRRMPRINADITVRGQVIHKLQVPEHMPADASADVLHRELAKRLARKA
jgi:hypothetical protein